MIFYRRRLPAVASLVVLAGYLCFQNVQRERALEFATEYARKSGMSGASVTVHPRPVTPYNWTAFVSDGEVHRFAHINLERTQPKRYAPGDGFFARLDAPYLPPDQAIWVKRSRYGETRQDAHREAWNSPPLGFFRWFAGLPAFDGESEGCAWFVDLRFDTPGRDYQPFRYGACRDSPAAPWRLSAPA